MAVHLYCSDILTNGEQIRQVSEQAFCFLAGPGCRQSRVGNQSANQKVTTACHSVYMIEEEKNKQKTKWGTQTAQLLNPKHTHVQKKMAAYQTV